MSSLQPCCEFNSSYALTIDSLVEIKNHVSFNVEGSRSQSVMDCLDRDRNSSEDSQLISTIGKLLILEVEHFQS